MHSLDLFVFICVYCAFVFHTAYMMCYSQHSGVDLMGSKPEAQSLGLLFLSVL